MHCRTELWHDGWKHFTRVSKLHGIINVQVHIVKSLLDMDRWRMMHQLSLKIAINQFTVCHITKISLGCGRFNHVGSPITLTKSKIWHKYADVDLHLKQYHNKVEAFLRHITALHKPRHWHISPKWNSSWMNGTIHSSNTAGSKWCSLCLKISMVSSSTMWSQQVAVHEYYQAFLEHHLHAVVWQKCPHFILGAPSLVLHDNTCCCMARPVQDHLAWLQRQPLEHSPCSVDTS